LATFIRHWREWCIATIGLCLLAGAPAHAACVHEARTRGAQRNVPSPDWRDQIVYLAMIDRFDDGDAANNDQHAGEYDPQDPARYNGGDLCGLAHRLDYIHDLGATALWITPPVANQWWDGQIHYGGYHGYWAENFMQVDAHFGNLGDYRALAEGLHARKMFLIQDIVLNHVGNFFSYRGGWDAKDPAAHFTPNPDSHPHAPTQQPFAHNDVRKAADRELGIYHWTPTITDFKDVTQQFTYQLAELDDLNTESPAVRRALRESYDYWIREVGVDGFRVDTAFYVPPTLFRDFLYSTDRKAPGVLRAAAATGRKNFHLFGEGFGLDQPFDDTQAKRIDAYQRDAQGPLLPGMINFPLYGTTLDVFAHGHPTAELTYRLKTLSQRAGDPHLMPTFVDNHDVDRFLATGTTLALQQSLLMIMTVPGIPVIYYGTEQGFTSQRGAMFAAGTHSTGRDHFDRDTPMYKYLQRVIALRRSNPVLSHGNVTTLADNAAGAGGLVYRMDDGQNTMLVAFNTADTLMLVDSIDTHLPRGTRLRALFAIDGTLEDIVVGEAGRVHLTLPPSYGAVWKVDGVGEADPIADAALSLDTVPAQLTGDVTLSGTSHGIDTIAIAVDGNLDVIPAIQPERDGRWQVRLDTSGMIDPAVEHRIVAWAAAQEQASEPRRFRVTREWKPVGAQDDPIDDDRGPGGHYTYPDSDTWIGKHSLDIRQVAIFRSGAALRVELQMRDLLASWNPPNGFDHLAVTAFVELPGQPSGARDMPQQRALLPGGMRWHYRLRANGWDSAWFSSAGATADNEGTLLPAGVRLHADRDRSLLGIVIPGNAFPPNSNLSGARIYITTWDYDGVYRPLTKTSSSFHFGGGAASDAKVMDDTAILTLP
jgi:glycosidase